MAVPLASQKTSTNNNNNDDDDMNSMEKSASSEIINNNAHKHRKKETFFNKLVSYLSVEYILLTILVPILSRRLYRLVILSFFGIIFLISLVSLQWLSTETSQRKMFPDDSFIIDFLDALESGFGDVTFAIIEIVVEDSDMSDDIERGKVTSMIDMFDNDFESNYGSLIGNVDQWLFDFEDWINSSLNESIASIENSSIFYDYLQTFANDSQFREWSDVIIYDNDENPSKIVATKV